MVIFRVIFWSFREWIILYDSYRFSLKILPNGQNLPQSEVDQNAITPVHDLKWPVTIIINHFISESWILIACSSLKIPRKNNFKLSTKFLGWSNRGFCTSGPSGRSGPIISRLEHLIKKGRVLFSFKFQLFVHIYINYVNNLNILFILI